MGTKAKKMGRPIKPSRPGERAALGFRITADTKQKLVSAAEKSGRSQSQEAEFRLEQSFKNENLQSQIKALNQMLDAMSAKEARAGRVIAGWISDELRQRGVDEAIAKELSQIIRAYYGKDMQGDAQ